MANVALAGGVFHRWIWKPYQAGTFKSGASGRTVALVKAGLAGTFAAKQLNDAKTNVMSDPALCKVLYQPLNDLTSKISGLKGRLASGDTTAITDAESAVTSLKSVASQQGMPVTEDENASIG